ncbi:MAG: acetyl-CoA hydrolase/transferase family protein [Acidimicrobiales bacterium]
MTSAEVPWTDRYADRVITPAAAALLVRDGDFVSTGLPEPTAFLEALGQANHLNDFTVFVPSPRWGGVAVAKNPAARPLAAFITQVIRDTGGDWDVLPLRLNDWGGFARRVKPRVAVFPVAPPEADGTVRPGPTMGSNDVFIRRENRTADDLVLGLVNPALPGVNGDTFHVDDFDALIEMPEGDDGLPVYDDRKAPAGLDALVGALDELIPDGSTIQAGVGGIAEEALRRLTHKRDLGVHTEVLGAGIAHLIETGVATGAKKSIYPNEALFTISLPEAYSFVADNPQVRIASADLVLDPATIARNRQMRCINSTLEVDLWAQANAEMIDGVQYSGVGGQLDFLRGCSLADDALSILVLPSTAAGGTRSRIVPQIDRNAVTATRYDTQVVVTEQGVAWLRDATVSQKAERLIAVAHPDFRAELTEQAERAGII